MGVQTRVRDLEKIQVAAPITGEELACLGDIGRAELVKGEIVTMVPTGHEHGYVESNFVTLIRSFVRQHKLGRVLSGEVGIYTARNPDTVRGADVVMISDERMAQVKSSSYLDVAPELVVEIMSPDDRWSEVMGKIEEYLNIGVQMVWVADPKTRSIYAYRSLTDVQRFITGQALIGGDVLPGLSIPVIELFAPGDE